MDIEEKAKQLLDTVESSIAMLREQLLRLEGAKTALIEILKREEKED